MGSPEGEPISLRAYSTDLIITEQKQPDYFDFLVDAIFAQTMTIRIGGLRQTLQPRMQSLAQTGLRLRSGHPLQSEWICPDGNPISIS